MDDLLESLEEDVQIEAEDDSEAVDPFAPGLSLPGLGGPGLLGTLDRLGLNSSYPRLWTPMHPQPLLPGLR
jgi:hypothetical protein